MAMSVVHGDDHDDGDYDDDCDAMLMVVMMM